MAIMMYIMTLYSSRNGEIEDTDNEDETIDDDDSPLQLREENK